MIYLMLNHDGNEYLAYGTNCSMDYLWYVESSRIITMTTFKAVLFF